LLTNNNTLWHNDSTCGGEKTNELECGNSAMQAPRTAEAVVAGHICLDVIPTLVGGGGLQALKSLG